MVTPLRDRKDKNGKAIGWPTIFLDHMKYVFPNQTERRMVRELPRMDGAASEHTMSFGLLIVGRRGVGKSWFAQLLRAIFGDDNVLFIEKGDDVAAKFNADQANRQVIFVDELLPGGKMDVAHAIEAKIVAPTLTIEKKGVDKFKVANRSSKIGISNYENAMKVRGPKDRKWAVARATSDMIFGDANNKETPSTAGSTHRRNQRPRVTTSPACIPSRRAIRLAHRLSRTKCGKSWPICSTAKSRSSLTATSRRTLRPSETLPTLRPTTLKSASMDNTPTPPGRSGSSW